MGRRHRKMDIYGTEETDTIQDNVGTDDFIFGFGGDDRLEDNLDMGGTVPSNDVFFGGTGNDSIFSILGSDELYGGAGHDELDIMKAGGAKRVVADGGNGLDHLTLWDFNENTATVTVHGNRTVVEQGNTKIVIFDNVESWDFF